MPDPFLNSFQVHSSCTLKPHRHNTFIPCTFPCSARACMNTSIIYVAHRPHSISTRMQQRVRRSSEVIADCLCTCLAIRLLW